jgi:hypothetical protein
MNITLVLIRKVVNDLNLISRVRPTYKDKLYTFLGISADARNVPTSTVNRKQNNINKPARARF